MNFEDLAPELQAKARECKDVNELIALAQAEGHELSDDELAAISGGMNWDCLNDCSGYQYCEDYDCDPRPI